MMGEKPVRASHRSSRTGRQPPKSDSESADVQAVGAGFGCSTTCSYQRLLFRLIVSTQFLLAAAIVVTLRSPLRHPASFLIMLAGIVLSVWAIHSVGLKRIRFGPEVSDCTQLVRHGPYRWIRHPMYTGLLVFTASFAISDWTWIGWRLWLGLYFVLYIKSRYEETQLRRRFAEYQRYAERTHRFFPWPKLHDR